MAEEIELNLPAFQPPVVRHKWSRTLTDLHRFYQYKSGARSDHHNDSRMTLGCVGLSASGTAETKVWALSLRHNLQLLKGHITF